MVERQEEEKAKRAPLSRWGKIIINLTKPHELFQILEAHANGQILAISQMYWQEICSRYFVADGILLDASHSVLKAGLLPIDIRFPTPQLDHKMG